MALTNEIYVTFADSDGDITTRTWEVPVATTLANMTILVSQLVGLVVPLITGRIVSAGFRVEVAVPPLVAQASADIQELLTVAARSANGFLKRMNLPTINEDKVFVPGTKEADRTDTDVDAYLTALINGIDLSGVGGTGTVQFSDNHGSDLTSIEYAQENFNS